MFSRFKNLPSIKDNRTSGKVVIIPEPKNCISHIVDRAAGEYALKYAKRF